MTATYAPPAEMGALRDYVTGSSRMQQTAESTVLVYLTHNHLKAQFPEIRLDYNMTIAAVKQKIHSMCGTSLETMVLQLKDQAGKLVCLLTEDHRVLGYYSPRSGCTIHVIDTDGSSLSAQGWLEDVSKVEKYVMADEDYNKRDNTFRKYKEECLKADPTWTLEKEMCTRNGRTYVPPAGTSQADVGEEHQQEEASCLQVGQRCSVDPGERRGEIRFIGKVAGLAPGWWVGVAYDEPLGKNDGSVKGKRYFDCQAGYGGFVRPCKVTQGDFPPLDDFSDLGEEDEI